MPKGVKYPESVRQEAIARMRVDNNISRIAREMGIPQANLFRWHAELREEDEKGNELIKIDEERKRIFRERAWEVIMTGVEILNDKVQQDVASGDKSKIDYREISTVVGTLYDKQALAANEPTNVVGGSVEVKKFEDL